MSATTMTQVMRPTCEVYSVLEKHSYFGPGINNFGSPCIMVAELAFWWSTGTAWDEDEETSKKSTTVFAANDPLLKQGHNAKGRKHHLIIAVGQSLLPPAPVAVSGATAVPLPMQWVDVIKKDKGESTAIFGPRHVKADVEGTNEVATMRYSGGAARGFGNLAVCCDPMDHPLTFASQTPNTVFLGMTQADTDGAWLAWFIAAAANAILDAVIEKVASGMSKPLRRYVTRLIGRTAGMALRQLLRLARRAGVFVVEQGAAAAIDAGIESAFNMEEGRFDHTDFDDNIADAIEDHWVSR